MRADWRPKATHIRAAAPRRRKALRSTALETAEDWAALHDDYGRVLEELRTMSPAED